MRKIILVSLFIICVRNVFAQEEIPVSGNGDNQTQISFEKPKLAWKEKLRYGGTFWLGFFGAFYVDASPMLGYELNDKGTLVGIGANFIFQGTLNRNSANNTNNAVFGPRIFIRQQVFKKFFAHAEYEFMRADAYQFYSYIDNSADPTAAFKKIWGSSPLIGVGFYQGTDSQRGSFISLMYNLGYPNKGFISPQSLLGNDTPITLRYGILF